MGPWVGEEWKQKAAHRQGVNIEDEEVEGHGQADGTQQPDVHPGRHPQQGLVLRQAVAKAGQMEGEGHTERCEAEGWEKRWRTREQ